MAIVFSYFLYMLVCVQLCKFINKTMDNLRRNRIRRVLKLEAWHLQSG